MAEHQPIPFNPVIAAEVLSARTESVEDEELGGGIKFSLPTNEALTIFFRDEGITAAQLDAPPITGYLIQDQPLTFVHGPDWIEVRGRTEDQERIPAWVRLNTAGDATVFRAGHMDKLRADLYQAAALDGMLDGSAHEPGSTDPAPHELTQAQPQPPEQAVQAEAARGVDQAATVEQSAAEHPKEKVPSQRFTGTLGTGPLRSRREGPPRVKFALYEHVDGVKQEDAIDVWAVPALAGRLAAESDRTARTLKPGTEVAIRGYRNTYTTGRNQGKEFISALAIGPVAPSTPGGKP